MFTELQVKPGFPKHYATEASTIGAKPGLWPISFNYLGTEFKLKKVNTNTERELESVLYEASNGERVTVFND